METDVLSGHTFCPISLIFLESRFSVYVEYSSIENIGFNSVEEVKKVIEQSETIEQWEANHEKYSTI